ncbi:hypothetical protein [Candidatus Phytoplasma solani]|uniref:Uncharacterized protein n=1 Tax=Candidatus Phytoplasma solani TaxID=69896 RepID=A0A421NYZ6_9MOLU|nr:hypothetical protein [Candidatus Phytoplasma solani]RMI89218.1 hypothetical protein PSSA1_v1c0980 [Candidatus Phytoplasma solani]
MNSFPKKAVIKKNNFTPNKHNPYQGLLQNKLFHLGLICVTLIVNLMLIYLFRNEYDAQGSPAKETQLHLTVMFSGMFLGGLILGLKKGSFGISLGVFLGATLGMWLSLATGGNIISWMMQ